MDCKKEMEDLIELCRKRYATEKGKILSPDEEKQCYYSILGILERNGYKSAYRYVMQVKLGL